MHIHLIAICGTGMGALAGLLKKSGHRVTGSDRNVYPPMSAYLENLGINIFEGYRPENLREKPDLVVIGNAVRKDNPEARAAIDGKLDYLSFPGALQRFFLADKTTIAVTGTHGKTTTTALLSWILTSAGLAPSFLVGGICANFDGPVQLGQGDWFVIEGDEYDTAFFDKVPKFIRYRPDMAILANVEFDHADIYPDFDAVYDAFAMLVSSMPEDGFLAAGVDCPSVRRLMKNAGCEIATFALDQKADIIAADISFSNRAMNFRIMENGVATGLMKSPLVGRHNLKNILAAYVIARKIGIDEEQFQKGLETFKGVKRRQEVRGVVGDVVVIDDFAHHPTAVRETLDALRLQWQGRRILTIFEPRTNTTRRNYFQKQYAESFDSADEIILAPVYNADEIDANERFDPHKLVEDLRARKKKAAYASDNDDVLEKALESARPGDLVVILSNGGFDGLHRKLIDQLRKKNS